MGFFQKQKKEKKKKGKMKSTTMNNIPTKMDRFTLSLELAP
jgi:hypothetical protein